MAAVVESETLNEMCHTVDRLRAAVEGRDYRRVKKSGSYKFEKWEALEVEWLALDELRGAVTRLESAIDDALGRTNDKLAPWGCSMPAT